MHGGRLAEGRHWLALKLAWSRLTPASRRIEMDDESTAYFTALSARYFAQVLGGDGQVARFRLSAPPPAEVWDIVFRELYQRRTRTGQRVLDDIYMKAFQAARERNLGDDIAGVVGFLKNQFGMRLRDVVRSWAREQIGTLGDHETVPIDEPESEYGNRTRHDIIPLSAADEASDPEIRELRKIGRRQGAVMFREMEDNPKTLVVNRACLVLQEARVSLAHPLVTAEFDRRPAALYERVANLRGSVLDWARNFDDAHLDNEGRYHLAVGCNREICDRCEKWFFSEMRDSPLFTLVAEKMPAPATTSHDTPS